VSRIIPLWLLLLAAGASAQDGLHDPVFKDIPFKDWLSETGPGPIRWTVKTSRLVLSFHQRLIVQVEMLLDGKDLAKRAGKGKIRIFVQIADKDGRVFQDHGDIDLTKMDENIKASNISYVQSAFVLPGDYRVAVAILSTATGEHGTRQDAFRVAPLKGDPLPEAWHHLPPVEFVSPAEPPDGWFQPLVKGQLAGPADLSNTRVDIVVNLAASERARQLSALLPTLKAICAQAASSHATVNVQFIDLSRRRVPFKQQKVVDLDWDRLKDSLAESSAATIDVKALSDRHHSAAFFVSQIGRILSADVPQPRRLLVVLGTPMTFESGEDLEPIHLESRSKIPVFYLRYQPPTAVMRPSGPFFGHPARGPRQPMPIRVPMIDQLAPTLKPAGVQIFDVETPDQIRKALAAIFESL